jgi:hypothetical protein
MGDGNAVRKPKLSPAYLSSFEREADLNTSSNNLATIAQNTLLTMRDLRWLLTVPGGSEGREQRWSR